MGKMQNITLIADSDGGVSVWRDGHKIEGMKEIRFSLDDQGQLAGYSLEW